MVLKTKYIRHVLSLMTLAIVAMFSVQAVATDAKRAVVGQAAPDFTLVDTHGESRNLSDFIGQTVVLEWTNHECPCVTKHYDTNNMQTLQKDATDDGVVWLVINSSAPGLQGYTDAAEANKVIEKIGSNETARLLDPTGEVGRLYNARTTPHMYVIDAEGVLVYAGAIDSDPSSRHEVVETADNYVRAALEAIAAGEEIAIAQTQPYGCAVKYDM